MTEKQTNPLFVAWTKFTIETLDAMTAAERRAFFDQLSLNYCMDCYGEQPASGKCSCWNEELE